MCSSNGKSEWRGAPNLPGACDVSSQDSPSSFQLSILSFGFSRQQQEEEDEKPFEEREQARALISGMKEAQKGGVSFEGRYANTSAEQGL